MGLSLTRLVALSAMHCTLNPHLATGAYTERNRNNLVREALSIDPGGRPDYIFWVDTDMEFPPDTLLRLLAHNLDYVGCNYRRREPPHDYLAPYEDGDSAHALDAGLHEAKYLPGGMCLARAEMYRRIPFPWYKEDVESDLRDELYFAYLARQAGYQCWLDMDLTRRIVHDRTPWYPPDTPLSDIRCMLNPSPVALDRQSTVAIPSAPEKIDEAA